MSVPTESPDIPTQKRALREMMRARLAAISPDDARVWSGEIASLLHSRIAGARRALLYWPINAGIRTSPVAEADLRALVSSLVGAGVEVALPRTDWVAGVIEPRIIRQPHEDLVPGRHGLSEPAPRCAPQILPPDVVVAPGLAFDTSGGRLGRGAGFYDRFLARLRQDHPGRTTVIGACFGIQVIERVPREAWDQGADEIWTEAGRIAPP